MARRRFLLLSTFLMCLLGGCRDAPDPGVAGVGAAASENLGVERPAPPVVGCRHVTKTFMSTTIDSGATFIPFGPVAARNRTSAHGLAALDDEGTLVAHAGGSFWGSENDGCTWVEIHTRTTGDLVSRGGREDAHANFRVSAGPHGYAYGWEISGEELFQILYRPSGGVRWSKVRGVAPIPNMRGFVVDATDPLRIRTGRADGQIYESLDGGTSWVTVGGPAGPARWHGYFVAFDANSLDHAVWGCVHEGGFVTFDGGQTWMRSQGLTSVPGGRVNLFKAVISPVDGNTVFAMGLELETGARHIYASTDGGRTYHAAVDHGSDGVYLTNGPFMMCDPWDSGVLRFLFSPSPGFGATRFFAYDLDRDELSTVYKTGIPKVRVMAHSRLRPGAIHVGFEYRSGFVQSIDRRIYRDEDSH